MLWVQIFSLKNMQSKRMAIYTEVNIRYLIRYLVNFCSYLYHNTCGKETRVTIDDFMLRNLSWN